MIGRVTDTGRFRVYDGLFDAIGVPGENPPPARGDAPPEVSSDRTPLADVPVASLGDGPVYDRPLAPPADLAARQADDPAPVLAARFPAGTDLSGELLALLASPTIADKSWVYRQYDHQLFLNTVVGPGGDATVLRLKGTDRGLALSTDGKARFCALDPRTGARLVVLEAARNLACAGAEPKALVNCLNFGNPEHPEVMWQFSEVVDGMSEACVALGIPVVGGNVSFYNESRGTDIDPTPVVGVIGLVDALTSVPPTPRLVDGDAVVVLGTTGAELGGSEWATLPRPARRHCRPSPISTPPRRCTASCATSSADRVVQRRARLRRRRPRGRGRGDGDRRRGGRDARAVARRPRARRRLVLGVGVAGGALGGARAGGRGARRRRGRGRARHRARPRRWRPARGRGRLLGVGGRRHHRLARRDPRHPRHPPRAPRLTRLVTLARVRSLRGFPGISRPGRGCNALPMGYSGT